MTKEAQGRRRKKKGEERDKEEKGEERRDDKGVVLPRLHPSVRNKQMYVYADLARIITDYIFMRKYIMPFRSSIHRADRFFERARFRHHCCDSTWENYHLLWKIFPVSFKIICLHDIMSQKLKIIVVGPKGSGKSTLSNFLLGQSDGIANNPYQPTVGCRILENDFPGQGNQMVSVELWDASGDNR